MADYAEEAYERISWRGVTLNRRTAAMLTVAERRAGVTIDPTQGSYNKGGVSASAGTHDGGGAVDLVSSGLSSRKKKKLVRELRNVGFAAWLRPYKAGVWPEHIHAIAIGDRELAPLAAQQVAEYKAGGDGLSGSYRDPMPYRPSPIPVFSYAAWARRQALVEKIDDLSREISRTEAKADRLRGRRDELRQRVGRMK